MTTRSLSIYASVLSLCLISAPDQVSAQGTADQIFHACYIPLVGVVYRIKAPGLPTACLARTHVEFEWNARGERGETGATGATGAPGNLALAGQNCPTTYFVTGFTSSGGLVCRNAAGEEVSTPPSPPPANALDGLWGLNPAPSLTCTSTLGNISVKINGIRTLVTSANHLSVTLFGELRILGVLLPRDFVTVDFGAVPTSLTFPISGSGSGSMIAPLPLSGTVNYEFTGVFASANSVSGSVNVSADNLRVTVETPGFPTTTVGLTCPTISGTFTAAK
jgi:hypothetical protein